MAKTERALGRTPASNAPERHSTCNQITKFEPAPLLRTQFVITVYVAPHAMIESCYWKEELARIAKTIRHSKKPARWSERAHCIVERDLMLGFFIVRRLIELHKVSSVSRDFSMKVFSCPSRGKHVHRMNRHDIYELYDLEKERHETKKPFYISNQFIHAYTSFVVRDESRNWSDAYVVSDYDRNDCIWRVPVPEIRRLFSATSRDYPHSVQMVYDREKGDYEVATN